MSYPISPFAEDFDIKMLSCLKGNDKDQGIQIDLDKTLKWLCSSPKITSFRVNTLKVGKEVVLKLIQEQLDCDVGKNVFQAQFSRSLSEVIIIKHLELDQFTLQKSLNEVVVDVDCGAAILRGAHIYAPGVMAMISGTQIGEKVSVYADLSKKCKKGLLKIYLDERKIFIGNGIVKMTRQGLFGKNLSPTGIAIEMKETISGSPTIGHKFLPIGWALLQNLPSIICVQILNPQSDEVVLDMCAAPGNKTTHIAALMNNKGTLIAIDKTPKKLEELKKTCRDFGASVMAFQADSTKIVLKEPNYSKIPEVGPPFVGETFDRILLDAPCSALGKRPQLLNKISEKVIRSYVPLQRKLFEAAFSLLKVGGTLVYSTCTITLAENEGIVAWALKTFDCLELINPSLMFGGKGWPGTTLEDDQRDKVQRFGPDQHFDTVGFFIACFVKVAK